MNISLTLKYSKMHISLTSVNILFRSSTILSQIDFIPLIKRGEGLFSKFLQQRESWGNQGTSLQRPLDFRLQKFPPEWGQNPHTKAYPWTEEQNLLLPFALFLLIQSRPLDFPAFILLFLQEIHFCCSLDQMSLASVFGVSWADVSRASQSQFATFLVLYFSERNEPASKELRICIGLGSSLQSVHAPNKLTLKKKSVHSIEVEENSNLPSQAESHMGGPFLSSLPYIFWHTYTSFISYLPSE